MDTYTYMSINTIAYLQLSEFLYNSILTTI